MSKETKNKIVPKLRFAEFRDNGEWKQTSLIEVADKKVKWSFTGGPFGSNLKSSDYVSNGVRIIQLQNIGDGEFLDNYKIFTSEEKADELLSCNIYPDEIILSKMGDPVGRACLIPSFHNRYVMCSDGIRLVVDEKLYNKYFIYTLINSEYFRPLVEKTATGSTRKRIGLDELKNLPMNIPNDKMEQQKISDCFSSLDELIAAETQKLEALKVHKWGLMQQLFPAEGETVPKLRFVEFVEEWEKFQLEDVTSYFKGFAFESKDYTSTGRRIIRVSDMGFDYIKKEDKAIYISEEGANQYDRWKLEEHDLIVTTVGSKPPMYDSLVGRTIVVKSKDEGSLLNQNAVCLRANIKIKQPFLNALFKRDEYITFIESIIRGNANQGSITLENLFQFKLLVPNLNEQQKIAECLSYLDELIAVQAEKIEILKRHKKGLMQGLFPDTKTDN